MRTRNEDRPWVYIVESDVGTQLQLRRLLAEVGAQVLVVEPEQITMLQQLKDGLVILGFHVPQLYARWVNQVGEPANLEKPWKRIIAYLHPTEQPTLDWHEYMASNGVDVVTMPELLDPAISPLPAIVQREEPPRVLLCSQCPQVEAYGPMVEQAGGVWEVLTDPANQLGVRLARLAVVPKVMLLIDAAHVPESFYGQVRIAVFDQRIPAQRVILVGEENMRSLCAIQVPGSIFCTQEYTASVLRAALADMKPKAAA